jgi:hypothetical protein
MIKQAIANAQGMTIPFDQLVKLQLFQRCASPAAVEHLVRQVADSEDGKVAFLAEAEAFLAKGEICDDLHQSWKDDFVAEWLKLSPRLGDIDLRPLLYLSRDRVLSLASFDEISPEGRGLLEAILASKHSSPSLITQLKELGEAECERILNRLRRRARADQWEHGRLTQALHITKAYPNLGSAFVNMLSEIPPASRHAALIPRLGNEPWAIPLLKGWEADEKTPARTRTAIAGIEGKP